MCTPDTTLYPILVSLLTVVLGPLHLATLKSVSALLWALLLCQSLHVSDLSRALPDLTALGARQAMRRVRRRLQSPTLMSQSLTPSLVRMAWRLLGAQPATLVLDSTRCLHWEIFTLGVVFHGRVLPISWAILPYPWPKGKFTPTVLELLERTFTCWPVAWPLHLVADRGFPSLKLFRCLHKWAQSLPLDYTIRLRAGDWVRLADGPSLKIATLLAGCQPNSWSSCSASYVQRKQDGPWSLLVIGHRQPQYPPHQRGPAEQARRQARQARRRAHLLSKGQAKAPDTDGFWVLLSSVATMQEARRAYELRFHTEGMYRDLKSWDLEAVVAHQKEPSHLQGLVGLAVLGYYVQVAIGGAVAGCTDWESVQARQRQWCTTDRLSVFWRGRQVLHDRAYDWCAWLRYTLTELTHQLAPATSHRNQRVYQSPLLKRNQEAA